MDRNEWIKAKYPGCRVALRKESVDRNTNFSPASLFVLPSLSARRAWIEMQSRWQPDGQFPLSLSARRAWIEIIKFVNLRVVDGSLSARRAWIEIVVATLATLVTAVALRKESVDRNWS